MPAVLPKAAVPAPLKSQMGLRTTADVRGHDHDSEEACVVCLDKPRSAVVLLNLAEQSSCLQQAVATKLNPEHDGL